MPGYSGPQRSSHGVGTPCEVRLEPIITGTRNAAEVIGRADDLGTIEPGKLADLVVMAGDPLADISASRDIQFVVKDGTIVLDRLRPQHGHLH